MFFHQKKIGYDYNEICIFALRINTALFYRVTFCNILNDNDFLIKLANFRHIKHFSL